LIKINNGAFRFAMKDSFMIHLQNNVIIVFNFAKFAIIHKHARNVMKEQRFYQMELAYLNAL